MCGNEKGFTDVAAYLVSTGIKQLKSIMLRKKHFKRYYTYVSSILKEI